MRGKWFFDDWGGVCCFALIMLVSTAASGKVIYVDANAPGSSDGTKWADAYVFLQDGLADADNSEKPVYIKVAEGIYRPDCNSAVPLGTGERHATFQLISGVTLFGGFAGFDRADPDERNVGLYQTILSGDLHVNDQPGFGSYEDNSYHVVTGSGVEPNAVIEGFTIVGGNANGTNPPDNSGAGMYSDNGFATIALCTFLRNRATVFGAGMYNGGGGPHLSECIFRTNAVVGGQSRGGGVYNEQSSATFNDCLFHDNLAEGSQCSGGGMHNEASDTILSECTFNINRAEGYLARGGGLDEYSSSSTLSDCTFSSNSATYTGGGMHNENGSPELTGCSFNGNTAESGGGVYSDSWHDRAAGNLAVFTNCTFSGNSSVVAGGGMYSIFCDSRLDDCTFELNTTSGSITGGGGMCNDRSLSKLSNCTFRGNSASGGSAGGFYNMQQSDAQLVGCVFTDNSARYEGGGIYNRGTAFVFNCTFSGNANTTYSHSVGGAMSNRCPLSTVVNCVFTENSAAYGGGMHNRQCDVVNVVNCTFSGNIADSNGAGIYNRDCDPNVANCILWGNVGEEIYNYGSESPSVRYSCIEGGYPGAGNITDDPRFDGPDLRVEDGSPCHDSGDNDALAADTLDLDGDGDVNEPVPLDFIRNGRRGDDPQVEPDTGNAGALGAPVVDMGAYELTPIFVDDDAPLGGDGASWSTAYKYLRDGLLASLDPNRGISEVRVGKGAYKPDQDEAAGVIPGDREATFEMRSGLAIRGGYRGLAGGGDPDDRDTNTFASILSGDLAGNDIADLGAGLRCFSFDGNPCESGCESFDADGDTDVDGEDLRIDENSFHVVTSRGTNAAAVLEGFTITGGNAGAPCADRGGGGIYNADEGKPTIIECTFALNRARDHGGGMYVKNGAPTVTGCEFNGNWAQFGAGMDVDRGSALLTDCTFNRNHADIKGGGLSNSAGLTMLGCTFTENSSSQEGGGVFHASPGDVGATDCSFFGNTSRHGGGVQLQYGDNTFVNCVFSGNSAETGGAMSIWRGDGRRDMTVANCTLGGNLASGSGAGVYIGGSGILQGMSVVNCIIWGNIDVGGSDETAQIDNDLLTDLIVTHSSVQGCSTYCADPNSRNIGADPLFADGDGADDIIGTADDNLRLSGGSPCIDMGDNDADTNIRTPEIEPLPETDLDGKDRIFDGNRDGTGTVDMGAYEFTSAYMGDLDGQYDVDFEDYSMLAAHWLEDNARVDIGGAPGGDGIIDCRDLAVLAVHWLDDIAW
ncbi:MAG: right-handed parallel beta-helix repeat-containing protein [Phycisphaerales bacterium]|nr:MAG: right-handed parallel beta-helix repeat-containing protein [Phycisphaerales bacterium]